MAKCEAPIRAVYDEVADRALHTVCTEDNVRFMRSTVLKVYDQPLRFGRRLCDGRAPFVEVRNAGVEDINERIQEDSPAQTKVS